MKGIHSLPAYKHTKSNEYDINLTFLDVGEMEGERPELQKIKTLELFLS